MLKESFIGRHPSHFQVNSVVKSFIVSETFLWSAWNFITPIFAIFAATQIPGGNVEIAASAFSTYLVVRVVFELISGNYLTKNNEIQKIKITIAGMILISISYLGFAFTGSILQLFLFYAITGIGMGISSPAKNSLFSTHLDKNREPAEWGIYDAVVFMGMALSAALGGFIANKYGFQSLFFLACMVNFIGILPYILYIRKDHKRSKIKLETTAVNTEETDI